MKKRELMKRLAALGLAVSLISSGPSMTLSAAPKDNSEGKNFLETAELIGVDQSRASGGITPTVFADSYKSTKESVKSKGRDALPMVYKLNELGRSTTVKNQAPWNSCWAFGALSSLESGQLNGSTENKEAADPDYSERQLAWFAYDLQTQDSIKVSAAVSNQAGEGTSYAEVGRLDKGGNLPLAVTLLANWQGAAAETNIPYQSEEGTADESGTWKVAADKRNFSAVHLQNADFLPSPAKYDKLDSNTGLPTADAAYTYDETATAAIKTALKEKGAVAIAYFADQSTPDGNQNGTYFNYQNDCQYVDVLNSSTAQNHSVSIVGWDDNYASTNFNSGKQPKGNGAWYVKNSWGNGWEKKNGYFWLSYYDRTIAQVTSLQGEAADNYDNNYQYDYLGLASAMQIMPQDYESGVANIFKAKGNEEIQAVSAVTLSPESTVKTQIYKVTSGPVGKDTTLLTEQTDEITYSGYHTLKLKTPVAVAAGEKFSVVQYIKGGDGKWYLPVEIGADSANQTAVANSGESFTIQYGECNDMSEGEGPGITYGNVMIKAFTNNVKPETEAPQLTSFDYEAFDKAGASIESNTVTVAAPGNTAVNLPAGTSYIKIVNPVLSDSADAAKQMTATVNGNAYNMGDKIERADIIKAEGTATVAISTKSTPSGRNTKEYKLQFSADPFVLKGDTDKVLVSDSHAYLPTGAAFTADRVNSGDIYTAVKTGLEAYGGAEHFYLYQLSLSPVLASGESVQLDITTDSDYPRTEKTVLYYYDKSANTLSEVANDSAGKGALHADNSQMGYYVVAEVKEKPEVPVLEAITYSPVKGLSSVTFPTVEGGAWAWNDGSIIPNVKTGTYKATFTPTTGSKYRTYSADIALTVNKATPVPTGIGSGSRITYGTPLSSAIISEIFRVDGKDIDGVTKWKDATIQPEVKDSNTTKYDINFTPTDTDNYNTATGKIPILGVLKKPVEVEINDAQKIYGDSNPSFSINIPEGALVGDDTEADLAVEFSCEADNNEPAGNYVTISGASNSNNYDVTIVDGQLEVKERTISVKAKDVTIKYGDALPASYEVEVSNLAPGEDQSVLGLTFNIKPQNVPSDNLSGTYPLEVTNVDITNTNYAVGTPNNGNLIILENAVGKVDNSSSIKGPFRGYGNLVGTEVLKIEDSTDQNAWKAFQGVVKEGQVLGNAFDISLKEEDGETDAEWKGALTITLPVDSKYNGKKVTVFHYVRAGKLTADNIPAETDTVDIYSDLTVIDGTVQVKVYSLSPFTVALPKDAETPGGQTNTPSADNTSTPKVTSQAVNSAPTGDSAPVIGLVIAAGAAVVIIIALVIIMMKRRKK